MDLDLLDDALLDDALLDDALLPGPPAAPLPDPPGAPDAAAALARGAVAATSRAARLLDEGAWGAAEAPLRESVALRERLHASGDAGPAVVARGLHDLAVQRLATGADDEARALLARARALLDGAPSDAAADALFAAVAEAWRRTPGPAEPAVEQAAERVAPALPPECLPPECLPPECLPPEVAGAPAPRASAAPALTLPAWASLEPAAELEFLSPPAATKAPAPAAGAAAAEDAPGGARTFVIPGLDAPPPRPGLLARLRRRLGR